VDKEVVVVANFSRGSKEIHTTEYRQNYFTAKKAAQDILKFGSELVILESTANYHMLFHDAFKAAGLNVKIINPLTVKALLRVEGKNDKADAITLAQLAASFSLRTSNMPDRIQREIRLHLRILDKVKRNRTQLINRVQSTLAAYGVTIYNIVKMNSVSGLGVLEGICRGMSSHEIIELFWKGNDKKVPELRENFGRVDELPDYVKLELQQTLDGIHLFNDEIASRERNAESLIEKLGLIEVVNIILSAPGVTPLLSLRIIGEMGVDFTERYSSAEKFVNAIGVCPANQVSGGKVVKKTANHGNKHLKVHLLNSVKGYCVSTKREHELKSFYDALRKRSTFKKAVSATARKLMIAIYAMVKYNQPYLTKAQLRGEPATAVKAAKA
jgi:transposase